MEETNISATEQARLAKNAKIKESQKATRERRKTMQVIVRELKINIAKLNKQEREQLKMVFVESKWIRNAILASGDVNSFKIDSLTNVQGFDKDGNVVDKPIKYLGSQMKQSVQAQIKSDINALCALKKKGKKVGKLKFVSEVNSIELKQFGVTYNILTNGVKVQGFKKPFKVFGMEQLYPADARYEFANAKLIKKASGYYIHVTCYVAERTQQSGGVVKSHAVGIDLGIKTTLTTSDGDKFDIKVKETESLKKAQRTLSKKQKGSNNRYRQRIKVRLEYERVTNRRQDKANKVVHYLTTNYHKVYMQDENIKGWHKGLFGSSVQSSALGTIKSKLISKGAILIDRFAPTTTECLVCGEHQILTLDDRIFKCDSCGYEEDRDIKAALTIMVFGEQGKHLKVKPANPIK